VVLVVVQVVRVVVQLLVQQAHPEWDMLVVVCLTLAQETANMAEAVAAVQVVLEAIT
jgi:hypothetical protein